jgi:predicted HD superfamily hydrolase involved in NAD metabolism
MEDRAAHDAILETADAFARDRLSDKRYAHTLRVADAAGRLAALHGLDVSKARLAALLHDAAREVGKEELLRIAGERNLPVGDPERESQNLLHGPVAAELARAQLGVEDEEVLEAIRVHTLGEPQMGSLALAVYVADKIEPGRDYPSVGRLRELASADLREAAVEALRRARAHNEHRGRETHPASLQTLQWLEKIAESRVDGQNRVPR